MISFIAAQLLPQFPIALRIESEFCKVEVVSVLLSPPIVKLFIKTISHLPLGILNSKAGDMNARNVWPPGLT